MEAMTSDREAFEKWAESQYPQGIAVSSGTQMHINNAKERAWEIWQASRAHLAQPAQAVDVGKVVGYLVEKKPRVVGDAPARSFYFADQHNPTDPNWWIAGEQKKYTVTPLTRAISGEKAAAVKNGRKRRSSVTSAQTPPSPPPQRRARRGR